MIGSSDAYAVASPGDPCVVASPGACPVASPDMCAAAAADPGPAASAGPRFAASAGPWLAARRVIQPRSWLNLGKRAPARRSAAASWRARCRPAPGAAGSAARRRR
ncbi:MAG TPA: hypothetical protein VII59_15810, partial [Streptosporangiaceae bacterium]